MAEIFVFSYHLKPTEIIHFRGLKVVISYIPLGSLGGNWPLVAPLVLVLAFVEVLAPVVLFWESLVLFVFSPPISTVVALPRYTHESQKIINHLSNDVMTPFRLTNLKRQQ